MIQKIWRRAKGAMSAYRVCRGFGLEKMTSLYRSARFFLFGRTGRYPIMSLIGDSIEQELAVARCMCSCRGDDDALNKADAELFQLRKIAESAELACGLLWMIDLREGRTLAAFHALRDAIGGSGSDGLGRGIQRAIDAGYEADHPSGCTWWAGKKDATQ